LGESAIDRHTEKRKAKVSEPTPLQVRGTGTSARMNWQPERGNE